MLIWLGFEASWAGAATTVMRSVPTMAGSSAAFIISSSCSGEEPRLVLNNETPNVGRMVAPDTYNRHNRTRPNYRSYARKWLATSIDRWTSPSFGVGRRWVPTPIGAGGTLFEITRSTVGECSPGAPGVKVRSVSHLDHVAVFGGRHLRHVLCATSTTITRPARTCPWTRIPQSAAPFNQQDASKHQPDLSQFLSYLSLSQPTTELGLPTQPNTRPSHML